MNACESKRDFLMAYRTRALGEADRRDLEAHLAACSGCRAAEARLAESLILVDAPPLPAPAGLLKTLSEREEAKPITAPREADSSVAVSVDRGCAYCRGALGEARVHCAECLARYHEDCFQELGSCGVMGCQSRRVLKPATVAGPRRRSQPGLRRIAIGVLAGSLFAGASAAVFLSSPGPGSSAPGGRSLSPIEPAPDSGPAIADAAYLGMNLYRGEEAGSYRVAWVAPNGPAARAGLREGDLVELFGGGAVRSSNSRMVELEGLSVGDEIVVRRTRDGAVRAVETIVVEPRPRTSYFGMIAALGGRGSSEAEGLEITGVSPGGPAYKADLRAGDRLLSFAGQAIRADWSPASVAATLRPGTSVEVVFRRVGQVFKTRLIVEPPPSRVKLGLEFADPHRLDVVWVQPDSAADRAGIRVKDRLVSLGRQEVLQRRQVERIITKTKPGAKLEFATLDRSPGAGSGINYGEHLVLPPWEAALAGPNPYRDLEKLGLELLGDPRGHRRIVDVLGVSDGGPAARAGLRRGDQITGSEENPSAHFRRLIGALEALGPGDAITLECRREGETFRARLTGE